MSKKTITYYDKETGRLLGQVSGQDIDIQLNLQEGWGFMDGPIENDTHYVIEAQVVERPDMGLVSRPLEIQANGADRCMISGIPGGAEVTSNGTTLTADGNPIEFVTDIPGEHHLSIKLWPYKDAEVLINAI